MQEGVGDLKLDKDSSTFIFALGKQLTFQYAGGSKLPIAYAAIYKTKPSGYLSLQTTRQYNIFKGQEDLLLWHSIFGNFDIKNSKNCLR